MAETITKSFTYEKPYDIICIKEVTSMINTNISNARTDLYKLANSCLEFNEVVNISTKNGNVILLSEQEYNNLVESVYLAGIPGVLDDIKEGVNTPSSELEKDVKWK